MTQTPPDNPMTEPSILNSIKKVLQIPEEYTEYDLDVLMHINSVLGDITDIGIGPVNGFHITGPNETWVDFIGDENRYYGVRTLVFLKVRLLFDPPQNSVGIGAMERQISEFMTRLSLRREATDWQDPYTKERVTQQPTLDGGSI